MGDNYTAFKGAFQLSEETVVSAGNSNALPAATDSHFAIKLKNHCLKCLHYKVKLNQEKLTTLALSQRLQIEIKLRSQLRDLKKDMITKEKLIENLCTLKQTASQLEISQLRKSVTV